MAKNRGSAQRRDEPEQQAEQATETVTVSSGDVAVVTASETGESVAVKDEGGELKFAPLYKYEAKAKPAADAKLDYSPNWAKRTTKFRPGIAPKGDKSVMAQIYAMVQAQPGIIGSELAVRVRYHDFQNRKRSKYLDGGIPAVGWAEGYIDGAVTKGYLKMERDEVKASEANAAAKSAEAEVAPAAQ